MSQRIEPMSDFAPFASELISYFVPYPGVEGGGLSVACFRCYLRVFVCMYVCTFSRVSVASIGPPFRQARIPVGIFARARVLFVWFKHTHAGVDRLYR